MSELNFAEQICYSELFSEQFRKVREPNLICEEPHDSYRLAIFGHLIAHSKLK